MGGASDAPPATAVHRNGLASGEKPWIRDGLRSGAESDDRQRASRQVPHPSERMRDEVYRLAGTTHHRHAARTAPLPRASARDRLPPTSVGGTLEPRRSQRSLRSPTLRPAMQAQPLRRRRLHRRDEQRSFATTTDASASLVRRPQLPRQHRERWEAHLFGGGRARAERLRPHRSVRASPPPLRRRRRREPGFGRVARRETSKHLGACCDAASGPRTGR